MMWFFAVLIVLLMGGVAVVAAGSGDTLSEEYDDRPDVRVQADGPLTAADLRAVRFTTAVRGYRASEVDALLARLSDQLTEERVVEGPVVDEPVVEDEPVEDRPPADT
jgi:DivIVA domain-containing protein